MTIFIRFIREGSYDVHSCIAAENQSRFFRWSSFPLWSIRTTIIGSLFLLSDFSSQIHFISSSSLASLRFLSLAFLAILASPWLQDHLLVIQSLQGYLIAATLLIATFSSFWVIILITNSRILGAASDIDLNLQVVISLAIVHEMLRSVSYFCLLLAKPLGAELASNVRISEWLISSWVVITSDRLFLPALGEQAWWGWQSDLATLFIWVNWTLSWQIVVIFFWTPCIGQIGLTFSRRDLLMLIVLRRPLYGFKSNWNWNSAVWHMLLAVQRLQLLDTLLWVHHSRYVIFWFGFGFKHLALVDEVLKRCPRLWLEQFLFCHRIAIFRAPAVRLIDQLA